jgi:hypothetical protein
MTQQKTIQRIWYKASLTPMAQGIFTDAFYPTPKRGSGEQHVFFTQEDVTPTARKVIVASKMSENGIRMLTYELAQKCLIPSVKATKAQMQQLDLLTTNLKL